ncbi:uncharacterized protein MEPE_04271 [Melanopsichium pennsylvanicum]|uniref:Uncharacterized protein n=2 Tax=Melanopsichium pennsylvanicum TaxID=63383 RepID=A0AAJ5C685_9BASI|nr:putative protein [Melanopsichium pennsylvanicum 4]SNX85562.1 uncharacterized protein MEPE_04271 [Melanopsichium pennsylvanicum]
MLRASGHLRLKLRPSRSSSRRNATILAISAPALLIFLLDPRSVAATVPLSPKTPSPNGFPEIQPSSISGSFTVRKDTEAGYSLAHLQPHASDSLSRRKHVTFQEADQQQGATTSDRSNPATSDSLASPAILRHEDAASTDSDTTPQAESNVAPILRSSSQPLLLADPQWHESQRSAGRSNAYNEDLIGKQTGSGYVFTRHVESDLSISNAGAALVTLFSRRDFPVSRPPLVPNSNSRLLIALIIVCIITVGILTVAAQEMYRRLQTVAQPRSPLRRRSGEGRSTRPLCRNEPSYTLIAPNGLAAPSLDEEEERIKTPPTSSLRSSAAISSLGCSPHNENGPDSSDEEVERKTPNDLHYLSLPFGIGIGYSYANIADGGDARTRINRLAARKSRKGSGSTLALSTGALPVPGTSGGKDGLRSRSRSFKELCRDAFVVSTSRDISMISEEADGEMTTVSTPRWGSSVISLDLSGSDRASSIVSPTGPSTSSMLPTSASSIALGDLPSQGPSPKGRYFGVDTDTAATGVHTLIDLGIGTPELAVSDPDGITRPASTPGVMPSQVARHPQVEQLRREGRSETGKRVGKGTPTNAKLF